MIEIINERLEKIAVKRWYKHKKRCELLGKEPPKKEDFIFLLKNNGGKCCYCGVELKIEDTFPFKKLYSIDHYVPLSMGGTSQKENLVVCCVACNIIKGTLSGDTYKELISKIGVNSKLFDTIFNESFNGKFANKIERMGEEAQ